MKYQDIEPVILKRITKQTKAIERLNKPSDITLYVEMVKQKERMVDALALEAEEGRDKLRKAAGRSKYSAIRRYPNGETHP